MVDRCRISSQAARERRQQVLWSEAKVRDAVVERAEPGVDEVRVR